MEKNTQQELSLGEQRVGINFNVSNGDKVAQIKKKSAELIDLMEGCRPNDPSMDMKLKGEINRAISTAQTHYEDAAMWAVKAVTKK